jgi:uncharacterized membrane protein required for colicin V production
VFDFLVLVLLLINTYKGFNKGFIQTILSTIGYITGGLAGILFAIEFMKMLNGAFIKVVVTLFLILFFATTGEFILGKMSLAILKLRYIPLLKFFDSLLGAGLAILRTAVIIYLFSISLIAISWSTSDKYITSSQFYTYSDSHLPRVLTEFKNIVVNNLTR